MWFEPKQRVAAKTDWSLWRAPELVVDEKWERIVFIRETREKEKKKHQEK